VLTLLPPAASWALVSLLGRGEVKRPGLLWLLVTVLGVAGLAGEGVAKTGAVRDEVGVELLNIRATNKINIMQNNNFDARM